MSNYFKILSLLTVLFTVFSCASSKKIKYLQNNEVLNEKAATFETKLESDDLLMIYVSGADPEAVMPFNLEVLMVPTASSVAGQRQQQLYLVDSKGEIDFPVLGKIKLGGLTRAGAVSELTSKLSVYVQNPVVNLRIMNFKVSVFGEVSKPGSFGVTSERITFLEALSKAGDLTIYGKRNNILLIREVDGKRITKRIDLTSADFVNSEFYYLKQNDIIYVEPNNTRVNSSSVGPNTSAILSTLSILMSVISTYIIVSNR